MLYFLVTVLYIVSLHIMQYCIDFFCEVPNYYYTNDENFNGCV